MLKKKKKTAWSWLCLDCKHRFPGSPSRTCAVPLFCSQSKAAVAATLETSDGVPAVSMSAETLEDFALIDV